MLTIVPPSTETPRQKAKRQAKEREADAYLDALEALDSEMLIAFFNEVVSVKPPSRELLAAVCISNGLPRPPDHFDLVGCAERSLSPGSRPHHEGNVQ